MPATSFPTTNQRACSPRKYALLAVCAIFALVTVWSPVQAQNADSAISASGIVVDARTNDPVSGAAVRIAGTTRGTAADGDGRFTLSLFASTAGSDSLTISALGYAPQTVAAARDLRIRLKPATLRSGEVVVTATRTAKQIEDVAVPIQVVTADEIASRGSVRLSDLLATVPGLVLADDHGGGVQVQGFSSDYTLILLDGEPLIGRTAGTLDLSRVTVAGVERVEVVSGPSSSLYGSDALAGVVNLVTSSPRAGQRGTLMARGGTFGASELTAEVEAGRDRWSARGLVNRSASGGYDLTPDAFGPTVPQYADWTADLRTRYDLTDRVKLSLGARVAHEEQQGAFALGSGDELRRFDDRAERTDWSVHPELSARLTNRLRLTTTLYGARYMARTRHTAQASDDVLYDDAFDQRMARAEVQADMGWSARHLSVWGGGVTDERLAGELRYGRDDPRATQWFAFGQHEWMPSRAFQLTGGLRFDAHSDYAARLTPRVSILARPADRVRLKASVGSGFKAPAFRQLYLSFTNAGAGYSVFGSSRLADGLAELQAQGQIAQTFVDPSLLDDITAESSTAYNVGLAWDVSDRVSVEVGGFWNEVRDLIETQPVAQKTNGQSVFGYFNVAELYTRGIDVQARARPVDGLQLTGSYQFLQARDRELIRDLDAGTVFGRDAQGGERRLALADYDGLFGRSPHSATLGATATRGGATLDLRARWRSRYGYRDLDGNRLANRADEFVAGYALVDATLSHSWALPSARLTLQLGARNLGDVTRGLLVPSMPGRTLFAQIGVTL